MTSPFVLPRTRVVAVAVAAALLALVAWQLGAARPANNAGAAAGGVHISLTVNGAKTGLFKGDDNSTSRTRSTSRSRSRICWAARRPSSSSQPLPVKI